MKKLIVIIVVAVSVGNFVSCGGAEDKNLNKQIEKVSLDESNENTLKGMNPESIAVALDVAESKEQMKVLLSLYKEDAGDEEFIETVAKITTLISKEKFEMFLDTVSEMFVEG